MNRHSPLGGSKAEQFIACNAAPRLVELVGPEEDADEPDYRRDGIAAHAVAAECLRTGLDPWNMIGDPQYPFFEKDHVAAVEFYLDHVREQSAGAELLIEHYVDDPDREEFGGTLDVSWFATPTYVRLKDYKHGAGLAVNAVDSAQLLYYAFGLLLKYPQIEEFELEIVQPRAWHREGAIRTWRVTAAYVQAWAQETLHPAMDRSQRDGARFVPGKHCRFCPVKIACPALIGMARAVAGAPGTTALMVPRQMTDEQLAAEAMLVKPAEMYFRAIMSEVARRMFAGRTIGTFKVVKKKADREWLPSARVFAFSLWGKDAWTEPTIKSPAQIDKLPGGKVFTAEHAFSPETGFTVAADDDPRVPVRVTSVPQAMLDKAINEA